MDWIRGKTIWFLTGLATLLGGITTRLATCTQQTTVVVTQVATHPTNQIAAVEAASFIANLFYGGPDDPFATSGAGGEIGKLTHVVLRKGQELFDETMAKIIGKTDEIIETSRSWASPQIQEGKRALQKKMGHSVAINRSSAFEGVQLTQENAENTIKKIIKEADAIVMRPKRTMVYHPDGQGLSISTRTGKFIGFVERTIEEELKR